MRASRGMAAMPGRLTADQLPPRGRGALPDPDACYRFVMGLWWDGPRRGGMLDLAPDGGRRGGGGPGVGDGAPGPATRARRSAQTDDARPAASATSASSSSCGTCTGRRRLLRGELLDERPEPTPLEATPGSCPGRSASHGGPHRPAARPARPGRGPPPRRSRRAPVRRPGGRSAGASGARHPRSSTPVGSPSASRQLPRSRRATAAALRLPARSRASIASLSVTSAPLLAHPALVLRQLRARRGPGSLGPRP